MKVFKYVFLLLTVFLMTSSSCMMEDTDKVKTEFEEAYGNYETEVYVPWQHSGVGYWVQYQTYYTYNDFSYMVSRSKETFGGYYYYDVWFYSNSYYWDGNNATYTSTNIKYVYVYVDGKLTSKNENSIGITFYNETAPTSLRFMSTSKYPKVWIKWNQMKAI